MQSRLTRVLLASLPLGLPISLSYLAPGTPHLLSYLGTMGGLLGSWNVLADSGNSNFDLFARATVVTAEPFPQPAHMYFKVNLVKE